MVMISTSPKMMSLTLPSVRCEVGKSRHEGKPSIASTPRVLPCSKLRAGSQRPCTQHIMTSLVDTTGCLLVCAPVCINRVASSSCFLAGRGVASGARPPLKTGLCGSRGALPCLEPRTTPRGLCTRHISMTTPEARALWLSLSVAVPEASHHV